MATSASLFKSIPAPTGNSHTLPPCPEAQAAGTSHHPSVRPAALIPALYPGCLQGRGSFMAQEDGVQSSWAKEPPTCFFSAAVGGPNATGAVPLTTKVACYCRECPSGTSSVGGLITQMSACWPASAPTFDSTNPSAAVTSLKAYWSATLGALVGVEAAFSDGITLLSGSKEGDSTCEQRGRNCTPQLETPTACVRLPLLARCQRGKAWVRPLPACVNGQSAPAAPSRLPKSLTSPSHSPRQVTHLASSLILAPSIHDCAQCHQGHSPAGRPPGEPTRGILSAAPGCAPTSSCHVSQTRCVGVGDCRSVPSRHTRWAGSTGSAAFLFSPTQGGPVL
jgi:hypothetical protein